MDDDNYEYINTNGENMNYVEYLRSYVGNNPVILVGSVVIVLRNSTDILLQKRVTTSYGSWGLPGGLMEMKESTEETARREVFEETGLRLGKLNLEEVVSGEDNYLKLSNGDEFYAVTIVYSTEEVSGNLVVDQSESLDVRYFSVDDLPDEIVGSHRRILMRFFESRTNGSI